MVNIMCSKQKVIHVHFQYCNFVVWLGISFQECLKQKWKECLVCKIINLFVVLIFIAVGLDGKVSAKVANVCVSHELLTELNSWKKDGVSSDEILDRLRLRCVPTGYVPSVWNAGICIIIV